MRILMLMVFFACTNNEDYTLNKESVAVIDENMKRAYFASGCFWCVEAVYESVHGVHEAISGYAGGDEANPTYAQVSAGMTGHTETVEVIYDPREVSYETLLKVFYASHDPTTVNGQHPDYGRQYRSAIFYTNEVEMRLAREAKAEVQKGYEKPVVTEIEPLKRFWPAESYHQDYEENNPNNPYVRRVSIPRLNRFKEAMPEVLKED